MKVENPAAFRFIMDNDVYLLPVDKQLFSKTERPEIDTPPVKIQPIAETPDAPINYIGKNLQHILVLAYYPAEDFMQAAHLAALENTFKRKNLSLDDLAIVNMAKHVGLDMDGLTVQFSPAKILILGKEALPGELTAAPFNQVTTTVSAATLLTFGFGEMMNSTEHKKAFWEQVKNF